jgi:hypothetical protein
MKRLLVLVFFTPGCSEPSLGPDSPIPAANCPTRCLAKLTTCGATSSQAMQLCPTVCNKDPTEPQMLCLENQLCSADLDEAMTECGLGPMSPPVDAAMSIDAPTSLDAMNVCIEQGAIRHVCQCAPNFEVRGCAPPPDACIDLCPDMYCGNGAVCVPE